MSIISKNVYIDLYVLIDNKTGIKAADSYTLVYFIVNSAHGL